jgi:hypothetical protein
MKYCIIVLLAIPFSYGAHHDSKNFAQNPQNPVDFKINKDKLDVGECENTTMLTVVFESGFQKDLARIYVNHKIKCADSICTYPTIGFAKNYVISKKNLQSLKLQYNNSQLIEINEVICYKYLYINHLQNQLTLNLSNVTHIYK